MPKHSTTTPGRTRAAHRGAEHADTAVLELYAELGILDEAPGRHELRHTDVALAR